MKDEPNELMTRWTLIRKLTRPECDKESWSQFYQIYQKLIHGVARKAGLTREEAEDATQETMRSIYANIKDFTPNPDRGSFKSWLMKTARWRIADQLKKRQKNLQPRGSRADDTQRTATIERVADPNSADFDAAWDAAWHQELLESAIQRVKTQVSPDQYQIFDFYKLRHMSAAEVARSLGISVARVYLASHRTMMLVQKEVQKLNRAMA